jgi:hypothetical protein
MTARMQQRRDTAANWTSTNPTLASGEMGIETDTYKFKVGNGSTAWTSLPYSVDIPTQTGQSGKYLTTNGTVTSWATVAGDIEGVTAGTGLTGGGTTGTVTLAIDSTVTTLTGSQTLTNKTLTSPVVTGGTAADTVVKGLEEDVNVVASAATGTINFDVSTASVWYYTSNATANHTLNFRYSSGTSLNTAMLTGDAITLVWLNTNGTTAYYPNVIQIDGSTITPKWQGGSAVTAGNASSIDAYVFTIIKTASATFTTLASQTKFA